MGLGPDRLRSHLNFQVVWLLSRFLILVSHLMGVEVLRHIERPSEVVIVQLLVLLVSMSLLLVLGGDAHIEALCDLLLKDNI